MIQDKTNHSQKERLDQFVLDLEFLLISVIQGVALGSLATAAADPIGNLQFEFWPYIISGFLFILTFWSSAVIHALSFIEWPLDFTHNFLYFLASFVEVIAINHMTNPLIWFVAIFFFLLIAAALYLYDLGLIKARKPEFEKPVSKQALYAHMISQQTVELSVFLPLALLFNVVAAILIQWYPNLFLHKHYHLILIVLQGVFGCIFLVSSMRNFKKRADLISRIAS